MKRLQVFLMINFVVTTFTRAQEIPKVVLITLDGLRWQELFTGADSLLIANHEYVKDSVMLKTAFWRETPEERRKVLMPFFWGEVAHMGQIHGNRALGSKMDLTNKMWFSYPGYNEILTGKADDKNINSNDKIPNPNVTVLEKYNQTDTGRGKVAAFGSWDVFPYIINEARSGIPVNAGFESATQNPNHREIFLNELQKQIPSPWGSVRLDAFTHHYALEYMRKEHPNFIYIAYGETDDFAHDGDYQAYLKSAQNTDALIKQLWDFTQQDDFYKDRTVFIVSTDHGRGTKPLGMWKSHGNAQKYMGKIFNITGSEEVWLVAFGKGISPLGEIEKEEQLYSNQIAPTLAQILNIDWEGEPLKLN